MGSSTALQNNLQSAEKCILGYIYITYDLLRYTIYVIIKYIRHRMFYSGEWYTAPFYFHS